MENCVKCGATLEAGNEKGRPKTYCSPVCRRATEMEIRRLDSLLGKLEEKASFVRQGGITGRPDYNMEKISAEIERTESRLRHLLTAR